MELFKTDLDVKKSVLRTLSNIHDEVFLQN